MNKALLAIVALLLLGAAVLVGFELAGFDLQVLARETWFLTARNVLIVLLAILAAYGAVLLVAARLESSVRREEGVVLTEREMRAHTLASITRTTGTILIVVVGIILLLDQLPDVEVGALIAGAGIAGIAIGFGAQSLVKDLIAGFFVLLENQFSVGDVIRAAGGVAGGVERMTLRVTYLRDLEGTLHIIPNGELGVVSNLTAEWSRVVGQIGISYDSDVDRAVEVMRQVVQQLQVDDTFGPLIVGEPELQAIVSFGESAVSVRALIKTHAGQHWAVQREFYRRLKPAFDREGIDIAYPHRQIVLGREERQLLGLLSRSASPEPSEGSGSRASPSG